MAARLVVLALFVAGCQCWNAPAVNQGRRAQYYVQKNDGSYQYGYDTEEGIYQKQEGDHANEVRGQFGADGGNVQYTAGVGGYVVTSLKKPDAGSTRAYVNTAPVRYATLEELATAPKQVDDTAEVKAAKASFKAAYDAAAAAAEAAPDVNIITGGVPVVSVSTPTYSAPAITTIKYSGPAAPLDASGRVDDTTEVKAAKASFKAAYDAAAAAAAAAPDDDTVYSAPVAIQTSYLAPAVADVKYYGPGAPLDASGRVDDTAEVKAAKASFKAAYDAAAAAAEAAPDTGIITGPAPAPVQTVYLAPAAPAVKYYGPGAPLDASGRVDDTAEVKAAKASFKAAYDAAAAAAEAAPDVNIITGGAPVVSYGTPAAVQTGYVAPSFATVKYSGPSAPLDASGRVDDTAEVKAAKASFKAAYDAAAAAAAAAPDDDAVYSAPAVAVQSGYIAPAPLPLISTTYIASKPAEIADFRSTSNSDGSYEFSYSSSDSSRHESADAANNVYGNFEFVSDDAQRRRVEYKAGADSGFVASGAHLPVSVSDTAEVAAAKASFKSAFESAAAAAAAAPDDEAVYSAPVAIQTGYLAPALTTVKYSGPGAPLDASGRVEDTAEVKAAKASFKTAYDAAAAAAEAAPDVNIITGGAPVVSYGAPAAAQTGYVAPSFATVKYSGPSAPLDASGRVDDTAEVKAAKASFKAAYDAAAAAAEAAPDTGIITGPAPAPVQTVYLAPAAPAVKYYGPGAPLDASGRVDDTAEVKAAKASFKAAYDAAAAAAEAAPDVNIITGGSPVVSVKSGYVYSAPAAVQTTYLAPAVPAVTYSGPAAPLDASGRVDDTAEVKAAKASFKAAYDAAAAAAEAAPDTGIITGSAPVVAPASLYSAPAASAGHGSYSASHGNVRTVSFDGITLMQKAGPVKYGYSYE